MISIIKNNLHKDICKSPEVHAFVLNLYLNGEEYPHKVDDYFPKHAVENTELLSAMESHMQDEDKHVLLYRKAIKKLSQPIVEFPMDDVYNHIIKKHTPHNFHILESDTKDIKTDKLASFMAHLHFLEKRIATSLKYHSDACHYSSSDFSEKAVSLVLSDEKNHVLYTKNAVFDLLPKQKALKMMEIHQCAEKKANYEFSSQQLKRIMNVYSRHFPRSRRWIYKVSSQLLEWSLRNA